jgi:integration host factor subunit beta
MTKSQLIDRIAERLPHVPHKQVEAIVNAVFESMADALAHGQRIEIRGFGSFSVKIRPAREGRNPKTGVSVRVPERRSLGFIAGKELRERLNPASPAAQETPPRSPASISGISSPASAPSRSIGSPSGAAEPLAAAAPSVTRYTLG